MSTSTVKQFLDSKKLKQTKAAGGNRNYFGPGAFLCRILGAKFDTKRKGGAYFAADLEIISSAPLNPEDAARMGEGQIANYYVDMTQDYALSNIRQVIDAILGSYGLSPADLNRMGDDEFDAQAEALLGEAQEAAGAYVFIRANPGVTKTGPRAGQPNCIPNWHTPTKAQMEAAGIAVDPSMTGIV